MRLHKGVFTFAAAALVVSSLTGGIPSFAYTNTPASQTAASHSQIRPLAPLPGNGNGGLGDYKEVESTNGSVEIIGWGETIKGSGTGGAGNIVNFKIGYQWQADDGRWSDIFTTTTAARNEAYKVKLGNIPGVGNQPAAEFSKQKNPRLRTWTTEPPEQWSDNINHANNHRWYLSQTESMGNIFTKDSRVMAGTWTNTRITNKMEVVYAPDRSRDRGDKAVHLFEPKPSDCSIATSRRISGRIFWTLDGKISGAPRNGDADKRLVSYVPEVDKPVANSLVVATSYDYIKNGERNDQTTYARTNANGEYEICLPRGSAKLAPTLQYTRVEAYAPSYANPASLTQLQGYTPMTEGNYYWSPWRTWDTQDSNKTTADGNFLRASGVNAGGIINTKLNGFSTDNNFANGNTTSITNANIAIRPANANITLNPSTADASVKPSQKTAIAMGSKLKFTVHNLPPNTSGYEAYLYRQGAGETRELISKVSLRDVNSNGDVPGSFAKLPIRGEVGTGTYYWIDILPAGGGGSFGSPADTAQKPALASTSFLAVNMPLHNTEFKAKVKEPIPAPFQVQAPTDSLNLWGTWVNPSLNCANVSGLPSGVNHSACKLSGTPGTSGKYNLGVSGMVTLKNSAATSTQTLQVIYEEYGATLKVAPKVKPQQTGANANADQSAVPLRAKAGNNTYSGTLGAWDKTATGDGSEAITYQARACDHAPLNDDGNGNIDLGSGFKLNTQSGHVFASPVQVISRLCFQIQATHEGVSSDWEEFLVTSLPDIRFVKPNMTDGYVGEYYRNPNGVPVYLWIEGGEPFTNGGYALSLQPGFTMPEGFNLEARVGTPPSTLTEEGTTHLCTISRNENTCSSVDLTSQNGPVHWYMSDLSKTRKPTTATTYHFKLIAAGKPGSLVPEKQQDVTLKINPAITREDPKAAILNQTYSEASGIGDVYKGGKPELWQDGSVEFAATGLPSGLVMDKNTGVISGTPKATTPTAGKTFNTVITFKEPRGSWSVSRTNTIKVTNDLAAADQSLTGWVKNDSQGRNCFTSSETDSCPADQNQREVHQQLESTGGFADKVFSLPAANLDTNGQYVIKQDSRDTGLRLSPDGIISGVPKMAISNLALALKVTDGDTNYPDGKTFNLTINISDARKPVIENTEITVKCGETVSGSIDYLGGSGSASVSIDKGNLSQIKTGAEAGAGKDWKVTLTGSDEICKSTNQDKVLGSIIATVSDTNGQSTSRTITVKVVDQRTPVVNTMEATSVEGMNIPPVDTPMGNLWRPISTIPEDSTPIKTFYLRWPDQLKPTMRVYEGPTYSTSCTAEAPAGRQASETGADGKTFTWVKCGADAAVRGYTPAGSAGMYPIEIIAQGYNGYLSGGVSVSLTVSPSTLRVQANKIEPATFGSSTYGGKNSDPARQDLLDPSKLTIDYGDLPEQYAKMQVGLESVQALSNPSIEIYNEAGNDVSDWLTSCNVKKTTGPGDIVTKATFSLCLKAGATVPGSGELVVTVKVKDSRDIPTAIKVRIPAMKELELSSPDVENMKLVPAMVGQEYTNKADGSGDKVAFIPSGGDGSYTFSIDSLSTGYIAQAAEESACTELGLSATCWVIKTAPASPGADSANIVYLDNTGHMAGIPRQAGNIEFTVVVQDSLGHKARKPVILRVDEKLQVLPNKACGDTGKEACYTEGSRDATDTYKDEASQFAKSGKHSSYTVGGAGGTWSADTSASSPGNRLQVENLPQGMSAAVSPDGKVTISGVPTATYDSQIIIRATDKLGRVARLALPMRVVTKMIVKDPENVPTVTPPGGSTSLPVAEANANNDGSLTLNVGTVDLGEGVQVKVSGGLDADGNTIDADPSKYKYSLIKVCKKETNGDYTPYNPVQKVEPSANGNFEITDDTGKPTGLYLTPNGKIVGEFTPTGEGTSCSAVIVADYDAPPQTIRIPLKLGLKSDMDFRKPSAVDLTVTATADGKAATSALEGAKMSVADVSPAGTGEFKVEIENAPEWLSISKSGIVTIDESKVLAKDIYAATPEGKPTGTLRAPRKFTVTVTASNGQTQNATLTLGWQDTRLVEVIWDGCGENCTGNTNVSNNISGYNALAPGDPATTTFTMRRPVGLPGQRQILEGPGIWKISKKIGDCVWSPGEPTDIAWQDLNILQTQTCGSDVKADLTGVAPGNYTLTVAPGNGDAVASVSRPFTVKDSPEVSFTRKNNASPGDPVTFTTVLKPNDSDFTYALAPASDNGCVTLSGGTLALDATQGQSNECAGSGLDRPVTVVFQVKKDGKVVRTQSVELSFKPSLGMSTLQAGKVLAGEVGGTPIKVQIQGAGANKNVKLNFASGYTGCLADALELPRDVTADANGNADVSLTIDPTKVADCSGTDQSVPLEVSETSVSTPQKATAEGKAIVYPPLGKPTTAISRTFTVGETIDPLATVACPQGAKCTYEIGSGLLPERLKLDANTGEISGTPHQTTYTDGNLTPLEAQLIMTVDGIKVQLPNPTLSLGVKSKFAADKVSLRDTDPADGNTVNTAATPPQIAVKAGTEVSGIEVGVSDVSGVAKFTVDGCSEFPCPISIDGIDTGMKFTDSGAFIGTPNRAFSGNFEFNVTETVTGIKIAKTVRIVSTDERAPSIANRNITLDKAGDLRGAVVVSGASGQYDFVSGTCAGNPTTQVSFSQDPSTQVIEWTASNLPDTAETIRCTITVKDKYSQNQGSGTYTYTVADTRAPSLQQRNPGMRFMERKTAVSWMLQPADSSPAIRCYSLSELAEGGTGCPTGSQDLGNGLSLNPATGKITGEPGSAGHYGVPLYLRADNGRVKVETISWDTDPNDMAFVVGTPSPATQGEAYSFIVPPATGGTPAYTYRICELNKVETDGECSANSTVNPAATLDASRNLTIAADDVLPDSFSYTLVATDSKGVVRTANITIPSAPKLQLGDVSQLPDATPGRDFSDDGVIVKVPITGGTGVDYVIRVDSGGTTCTLDAANTTGCPLYVSTGDGWKNDPPSSDPKQQANDWYEGDIATATDSQTVSAAPVNKTDSGLRIYHNGEIRGTAMNELTKQAFAKAVLTVQDSAGRTVTQPLGIKLWPALVVQPEAYPNTDRFGDYRFDEPIPSKSAPAPVKVARFTNGHPYEENGKQFFTVDVAGLPTGLTCTIVDASGAEISGATCSQAPAPAPGEYTYIAIKGSPQEVTDQKFTVTVTGANQIGVKAMRGTGADASSGSRIKTVTNLAIDEDKTVPPNHEGGTVDPSGGNASPLKPTYTPPANETDLPTLGVPVTTGGTLPKQDGTNSTVQPSIPIVGGGANSNRTFELENCVKQGEGCKIPGTDLVLNKDGTVEGSAPVGQDIAPVVVIVTDDNPPQTIKVKVDFTVYDTEAVSIADQSYTASKGSQFNQALTYNLPERSPRNDDGKAYFQISTDPASTCEGVSVAPNTGEITWPENKVNAHQAPGSCTFQVSVVRKVCDSTNLGDCQGATPAKQWREVSSDPARVTIAVRDVREAGDFVPGEPIEAVTDTQLAPSNAATFTVPKQLGLAASGGFTVQGMPEGLRVAYTCVPALDSAAHQTDDSICTVKVTGKPGYTSGGKTYTPTINVKLDNGNSVAGALAAIHVSTYAFTADLSDNPKVLIPGWENEAYSTNVDVHVSGASGTNLLYQAVKSSLPNGTNLSDTASAGSLALSWDTPVRGEYQFQVRVWDITKCRSWSGNAAWQPIGEGTNCPYVATTPQFAKLDINRHLQIGSPAPVDAPAVGEAPKVVGVSEIITTDRDGNALGSDVKMRIVKSDFPADSKLSVDANGKLVVPDNAKAGTYQITVKVETKTNGVTDITYVVVPIVIRAHNNKSSYDTWEGGKDTIVLRHPGKDREYTSVAVLDYFDKSAAIANHEDPKKANIVPAYPEYWEKLKQPWSKTAIMVQDRIFADALVSGPLAAAYNSPIVLTSRTHLGAHTLNALKSRGFTNVIIVGGTGAVSENVATTLRNNAINVERVGGIDRYETATLVANHILAKRGAASTGVFMASGQGYPDALSASSAAIKKDGVVLLTPEKSAHHDISAWLKSGKSQYQVAVGGPAAKAIGRYQVTVENKIVGQDRYETAAKMAHKYFEDQPARVVLASGHDFPDATVATAITARTGAPVLLTRPDHLVKPSSQYLRDNRENVLKVDIIGGIGAVNERVVDQIHQALDE